MFRVLMLFWVVDLAEVGEALIASIGFVSDK